MKLTNKQNLPEAIFSYLSQDFYDHGAKGDSYSATELLKPTQEIILSRRHHDKLEVDVLDRIWSLFGQGIHAVLEKERGMEPIVRVKAVVAGKTVSGKWDRIKDGKLTDYKCTSAWTVVYKDRYPEWRKQLSIYRWLYWKANGVLLNGTGTIIAILRDWSDKNLKEGGSYPPFPIMEIPFDLMSVEETEVLVLAKLREIAGAEMLPDELLPTCTDEERWYNKTKKTYMKCAKYCPVNKFCKQFGKENEFLALPDAEVA